MRGRQAYREGSCGEYICTKHIFGMEQNRCRGRQAHSESSCQEYIPTKHSSRVEPNWGCGQKVHNVRSDIKFVYIHETTQIQREYIYESLQKNKKDRTENITSHMQKFFFNQKQENDNVLKNENIPNPYNFIYISTFQLSIYFHPIEFVMKTVGPKNRRVAPTA